MSGNFCKRTERRLEKLGLEKKEARRFAGLVQRNINSPGLKI
jgi:sugar-specific transcriptional regulator TrmB